MQNYNRQKRTLTFELSTFTTKNTSYI